MAKKEFGGSTAVDLEIFEDGKKIGALRIKPNALLWKAKGKQKYWSVSVEAFAAFAMEKGKETEK
jgi:hypothetical protein